MCRMESWDIHGISPPLKMESLCVFVEFTTVMYIRLRPVCLYAPRWLMSSNIMVTTWMLINCKVTPSAGLMQSSIFQRAADPAGG